MCAGEVVLLALIWVLFFPFLALLWGGEVFTGGVVGFVVGGRGELGGGDIHDVVGTGGELVGPDVVVGWCGVFRLFRGDTAFADGGDNLHDAFCFMF